MTTYQCDYCGAVETRMQGESWKHTQHPATYTITATTTHGSQW